MFEDNNLPAEILLNPASVQGLVLTEFENRLDGVYSVADPNNSFNLLLEAASSINAQTVAVMVDQFDAQYAVRSTTLAELYNSMSDFDYLNLVASPSNTVLNLTFNIDYLTANAQPYDETYDRVSIPISSQFYVGPLTFGIYYPINININKITGNVNVLWDTTTINPLYTLETNMVPFFQFSSGGLNLITLSIPVSQFVLNTTSYPVVAQQGFIQKISYIDQFYAARVFTNLPQGSWTELAYTLSETIYDPTQPTAKINIQSDVNTLEVSIPQIYFTNNQIGNQVIVNLYTTKGAITLDLTAVEISNCNVNFNIPATGNTIYSAILANLATINLIPKENAISSGSNSLSFEQLRNLVINGGLYTGVPVTPQELQTYAQKSGFSITKYIDNVTNRIYYASNTITGGQNTYIMTTVANVAVIPGSALLPSSVLNFGLLDAVTILPTTIYLYNAQTDLCVPLSDAQVATLNAMSKADFALEVNTRSYTKCPFHLVTYTASQYPLTKSFNLMNPEVSAIRFVSDNVLLTPQMSVVSAVVVHKNNGTGGYVLRLGIHKNAAMQTISEINIRVYLSTKDINNDAVYGIATLTGILNSLYIYELIVPTTYYISEQGNFRSSMIVNNQAQASIVDLRLASTFTATFLINQALYPNVPQDNNLIDAVSSPYNTMLAVSSQQLDVVFGVDLSQNIYNATNAVWSATTYATYPQTVYQTYSHDVYETNIQGGLVYSISNGNVVLTKLHNAGDQILDTNGHPIVQHPIGSIKLDANGNPVVINNRQLQYYLRSIMFDLRLFHSQNTPDIEFVRNLTKTLSSYFSTITTIQNNLLEQTSLFYQPNNTMGSAVFSAGNNNQITLDLGFSFSFVVYVSQAVLGNTTLKGVISSDIISIAQKEVTKPVISLSDITASAKTQLADTIVSIDAEGIDNNPSLQTVIVPNGVTTPIIKQLLVYNSLSGSLSLQQDITINFELAA